MFGAPGEYSERLSVDVATGVRGPKMLRQRAAFGARGATTTPPRVTVLMGVDTFLS